MNRMMRLFMTVVTLLQVSSSVVSAAAAAASATATTDETKCGLYLAHSDIFGRLGVYTAKALEAGSTLNSHDIVIPLIEDEGPLWTDQHWSKLLGYIEWEGRTVRALLAGTGGAINLHSKLSNVEPFLTHHSSHEGTGGGGKGAGLHRQEDPGAGAFSYQDMQYTVTTFIPAGGQLLLNNVYSLTEDDITDDDYAAMDGTVNKLQDMFDSKVEDDLVKDVLGFLHSGLSMELSDTFPSNPIQFHRAKSKGTANAWTFDDTHVELSWLYKNGVCLDHIQKGPSTIQQAGRGAFATRSLPTNAVVVPIPVIPVSRFSLEKSEDDEHQLLRNYCFGHELSSLLLCPYGSPASYVNHDATNPNVKLVWSSTVNDTSSSSRYNMSVDDILKHPEPGLVFELVAIQDIQHGDEIRMDYGEGWHHEWEAHVEEWKVPSAAKYQSAAKMNQLYKTTKIKTAAEEEKNGGESSYPDNVFLAIRFHVDRSTTNGGDATTTYEWTPPPESTSGLTRPVIITARKRGLFITEDMYTVTIMNHPMMQSWDPEYLDESVTMTGVPRHALYFVDAPFTSDHHLEDAFRSEIQIPYDVFPEAWIDLAIELIGDEDEDGEDLYDKEEDDYQDEEL